MARSYNKKAKAKAAPKPKIMDSDKQKKAEMEASSSPRMPDSSGGTPPRSQPTKPFRGLGHRPLGWLERRQARGGGRSQLSPAHSRQLFTDKSSDLEDVENYEEVKLPSVQSHVPSELESAINGHLNSISPSQSVTSFSPKPGSLAEAVSKIKKDIQPVHLDTDTPRSQPAKSFIPGHLGHRPLGWPARRRGGRFEETEAKSKSSAQAAEEQLRRKE